MKVKQAIARAVCRRYAEDGVVLPTNWRSDAFVTYDVDNLDGQNKGNFSQDEFHGTALSATNHLSWDNLGKKWDPIQIDLTGSSTPKLPDLCAVVPPVQLEERTTLFAPLSGNRPVRPLHDLVHGAKVKDESWLKYVSSLLQQGDSLENEGIAWADYNSRLMGVESVKPSAEIGVLPLSPNKAATPAIMKHAMELAKKGTEFLNTGQTAVLRADQPLYAIVKKLQWLFPETLEEDMFVVMLGHSILRIRSAKGWEGAVGLGVDHSACSGTGAHI